VDQSVYRDYLDDLNPGTGCFPNSARWTSRADLIAHWFGDPNSFPLVILKGTEPVGFARVCASQPRRAAAHRVPHG